MLKDFKPAIFFLIKFLAIYFMGNVIYGVFVESFEKKADPITRWVTVQSSEVLNLVGFDTHTEQAIDTPTIAINSNGRTIVNVFEGCNGVNVFIVFIAFVFAFGGTLVNMLWFIPTGLFVIHSVNILRISLLYYISMYQEKYFYYFHKYFFTGILYLVVFALWALWVTKIYAKSNPK